MKKDDFRPLAFWSFNGDMEDEELCSQIRGFRQQGFGGFYMHARAGLTLEYLGKDWMHACRTAVEEAERQGITAWLYDENGWPSGFAGGLVPAQGEAYTAKHLRFLEHEPEIGDGEVLAKYRRLPDGDFERIVDDKNQKADLYCCMEKLAGYTDLLNPEAVRAFICFTHEKYAEELGEYFGNVIPGIFTDEPQLTGIFPYTFSYPAMFMERYGYDFFDRAWMLCRDGIKYAPFKHQAAQLVAKMYLESFTLQLEDWCERHGVIFTGHFPCEDGLCGQLGTNFDLMAHYGVMGRPGIDFLGRRIPSPVLVKQVSDAAYLMGKKRITSESFGCCGWDISFEDMLWIAGWQAAFGINSIVTHLSAYSMKGRRKRDYPAFYSYQEPWWEIFGEVAGRIERVNSFLSQGRRDIRLIVLHPATSMWCVMTGENIYSDDAKDISGQFRVLTENLISLQIDFLVVAEEELKYFQIDGGKIRRGDICCGTIIVPDAFSLLKSTGKVLEKFAQSGGRTVFINRKPVLCEGLPVEFINLPGESVMANRRGLLEKYFLVHGLIYDVQVIDGFTGRIAEQLAVARRITKEGMRLFVMNPSRCDTKRLYLSWKDGYMAFTLEPAQSKCFIIEKCRNTKIREVTEDGREIVWIQGEQENGGLRMISRLAVTEIALSDHNAITIDHCDIYLDDELICRNMEPAACADMVYQRAYGKGERASVRLIYRFEADFKEAMPEQLMLVAESEGITGLSMNGENVMERENGWWIDKSFHTFPVADLVRNGENQVEMEFDISRREEIEEQGIFEGYRNRFFYPVEPENIYLTGDFDVCVQGSVSEDIETLTVDGKFILRNAMPKTEGEFTRQNLWFYRGNIIIKMSFWTEGDSPKLCIKDMKGTAVEVIVNGKAAGVICHMSDVLPLTGYVKSGKNEMVLILYGSNRNLLGPHHHMIKNPHIVGLPTFLGQKGFTDSIYYPQVTEENAHRDTYSFVKLSCGQIWLEM